MSTSRPRTGRLGGAKDLTVSFRGVPVSEELIFYAHRRRGEIVTLHRGPLYLDVSVPAARDPDAVRVALSDGGSLRVEASGHPLLAVRDAFDAFTDRLSRMQGERGGDAA